MASTVLGYSDNPSFWISELALSSPDKKHSRIKVGAFGETERQPLYSVLIGTNGVGKSMLMKEIVDFFVDLHAYVNNSVQRVSSANKGRLRGIGYHFDEASKFLSLSKSYLYKLTSAGLIPHYKPQGKMIYFEKNILEEWLRQNPVKTQAQIASEAQKYLFNRK